MMEELPNGTFAVVNHHNALLDAIRKRIEELNTTYEAIEDVAGLQSGYLAKILGRPTPAKRLHPFLMFILLQALGLKAALVYDPDFKRKMAHRLRKRRTRRCVRSGGQHDRIIKMELTKDFLRHIARLGVRARMNKVSAERRSEVARRAATERWRQVRQRQAS
jgi:hypothetical protein